MYAVPTILPGGVGEEASQDLGVEIAFAFEIAIEAAVRQTCARHNLADGDVVEPIAVE